jgi:hypothetical protein
VTVFGPLKKQWNKSIDVFKEEFKIPMTRHHFFKTFDRAWKETTDKKHSIAGFKSTGLVPFNPDAVDYGKLIDNASVNKWVKENNSMDMLSNVDAHKKVGISMCLNKLKNILSVDECTLFETRYREGYDLHDDSSQGKLWQTYKAIRILLSTDATDAPPLFLANIVEVPQLLATNIAEIPPSSPTNTDKMPQSPPANYEEMPPSSPANIENGIFLSLPSVPSSIQSEVTLVVDSNMLQPLASTSSGTKPSLLLQSDIDIVSPSTPIMSPSPPSEQIADDLFEFPDLGIPSTSRQQSYDNFQFSPFKHYLKISENTIITRKPVKTKPKTPSAISGKEFRDNLKEQQEKKENELKEKERRKKEREEKN